VASLPKGSGTGTAFGERIASDSKRRDAAVEYWRKRLASDGETVMDSGEFSSDALKVAAEMPRASYASLLPEFSGFFQPGDEDAMVSSSGCLSSLKDLAAVTAIPEADLPSELKSLGGAEAAESEGSDEEKSEKPKPEAVKRIAKALRLAREVHDVARRFALCTESSERERVPRSELLAIYQQEGALGIAPEKSSWPYAPLIPTSDKGCRTHTFKLWDKPNTERTSYVVSHDPAAGRTPSEKNATSLAFGLALRHGAIIAGIDSIILPRLATDDELLELYTCIRGKPAGAHAPIDALKKDVLAKLSRKPSVQGSVAARQRSITSQADLFDGMCLGLLGLRTDAAATPSELPTEQELLEQMEKDFRALLDAHSHDTSGGRGFLAPADDFADARQALRLQAAWYAGRRRVRTLLAMRDRGSYHGTDELAPILAYLRYNIGEFNFMRCLIFFATRVAVLKAPKARKDFGLSDEFVNALGNIEWNPADAKVADRLLETWRALARTAMFRTPGWRNVGLIDALAAQGTTCTKSAPRSRSMELAADAAHATVTLYEEEGLFRLLEVFVLSHPLSVSVAKVNVVALKPADSLQPMRNAFSFERIRRVNAKAITDAGLPDVAPSAPPPPDVAP
jgi:hypothetical protein